MISPQHQSILKLAQRLAPYLSDPQTAQLHQLDAVCRYARDQGAPSTADLQSVAWLLVLSRHWARISQAFEQAGVPVVPLKGFAWAEALFPQPWLRPCVDLDILVHPDHVEQAAEILVQLGGRREDSQSGAELAKRRHFHWFFIFGAPPLEIGVELHWAMNRPGVFVLPSDELWRHARPGVEGMRLAREVDLLIAALHGVRHAFMPYRTLVDVARMLEVWGEQLDWQEVWRIARRAGAAHALALALVLAGSQLGAPLPADPSSQRYLYSTRVRATARLLPARLLLGRSQFAALRRTLMLAGIGAWRPLGLFLSDALVLPAERDETAPGRPARLAAQLVRPFLLLCKYLGRR